MRNLERLFKSVVNHIKQKDFVAAVKELEPHMSTRDVFASRARYLLFTHKDSPYFSADNARAELDFMHSATDTWGMAEKGRCLMYGEFYDPNPQAAEDLFMNVIEISPKAKYFMATLHDEKMHTDESGASYGIENTALNYYEDLMDVESPYQNRASLSYCRIVMKGKLSEDVRVKVFSILMRLVESGQRDAQEMLNELLIDSLRESVLLKFADKLAPEDMMGRVEFEQKHRQSLSLLESLHTILVD
tara:strand:+ start:5068 stop:5805 length:738 start_codon:yes stop_codon:yes gene_type:complete